jgi:hypothetical protein
MISAKATAQGEVAEWSNAPHSKCGMGATPSGVRISPSPPMFINQYIDIFELIMKL